MGIGRPEGNKQEKQQPSQKPQRRLSPESATVWLALMAKLLGSIDPKNDPKNFKIPEDLDLVVENWPGGVAVNLPRGSEIFLPSQVKANSGKPVRGTGYVMVTVNSDQRQIVYVLCSDKDGVVSFERRIQPVTYNQYVSSVPYPPTLA